MKHQSVRIHQRPDPHPPHLKWLINERAMLLGEVQQREIRIQRLSAEVEQARGKIAALDTAMALFDSRVNPGAGGVINGIAEKYGGRGGLQRFLLAQVAAAGRLDPQAPSAQRPC